MALEVTITEELRREGIARELVNRIQNIRKSSGFEITDKINIVNRIQNIRKSSGFEITDKINITLSRNSNTDDAVNEYNNYICNQVLANSLELVDEVAEGTELNFDDFSLFVKVTKQ